MVQITVTYSDGEQAEFDIQPKETVLDAAEKEEIPLAYNCKGGICRACQAIDKTTGKTVLLCQIDNVTEDLQYDVSYTKVAVSTVPTIRRAKLLEFDHVCPSVYKLKYKLQFPISFLPGQYARVLVPSEVKGQDKVWRYFSMANAPSDPSTVYFYIKDIPEGEMSRYLTSRAKKGDITKITAPYGAFYLRDNNVPKLFIAGGTGLAPMLSMLTDLSERSPETEAALVFGVTGERDLFALEEIHHLKSKLPNLEVVVTMMTPDKDRDDILKGTVVNGLMHLKAIKADLYQEAYLCGPPIMIEASTDYLEKNMATVRDIYSEVFSPVDGV